MKYAIIFRNIYRNGVYYFQALEKVEGAIFEDKFVVESESIFKDEKISPILAKEKYSYLELSEDEYLNIPISSTIVLKLEENELKSIDDITEQSNVIFDFYKTYKDFNLVPDFNIEEKIEDVRDDLNTKILGQDNAIRQILNKIYNNQMFIESELNNDEIRKHKSNILLIGPYGCGKTTIKESLKEYLYPIPTIECDLTGDFSVDITDIVNKLLFVSNGNKYLAERGIVIFDGINAYTSISGDNKLNSLKNILESRMVYGRKDENNLLNIDFSCLTFICMIDMDYDYTDEAIYDNTYMSKIDGSKLLDLGFTLNMLTDLFGDEVVYMNEITPELAFDILKDKEKSPLYKQKKVLESHGKKVRISKDFVDYLIRYGLDFDKGITGIINTLNVILENKDLTKKQITFSEKDLDGLLVSSAISEDEDMSVKFKNKGETKKNNYKDILKVDLVKRTINNLTINDTINIMKKTIKGQDKKLFYFVNAFYNHVFNQHRGYTKEELRELKENILLFGPSGSGKTTILEKLADIFKVPFVIADATQYSRVGYVGEDVNSILLNLIEEADGDVKVAEHGIVFVDEFDKIANNGDRTDSMDKAVQNGLLKIFEGHKRKISKKEDFQSETIEFDTSNLFIGASGAYEGLDKIVKARLDKKYGINKVGFKDVNLHELDLTPTDDDLKEYGHGAQMLGRLPNKILLSNLDVNAFYEIINNKEGGFIHLKLENYKSSGIKIEMSEEFKKALALKAIEKKTGARGLKSIFSDLTKEIDFNIQNGDIESVILDKNSLDNPEQITYVKRKK